MLHNPSLLVFWSDHMKSTNEVVRLDAVSFFQTLCSQSHDEEEVVKIAEIVIKAITGMDDDMMGDLTEA